MGEAFFTKEDLDSLKVYENTIDDEINGEPVVFFKQASRFFNKEVVKTSAYYKKILSILYQCHLKNLNIICMKF